MYLVLSAVLLLIIIGFMLISHKTALPVVHRILHIRSVLVTLVFCIAAVFCYVWILNFLDRLIGIPAVRQGLFAIAPNANVSSAFFWVITLLSCVIVSGAYCFVMVLVERLWLDPLSKKAYLRSKNPITGFLNWITSLCYKIDGIAVVKDAWVNVGQWIRVMRNIFSIVLVAEAVFLSLYLHLNLTWFDDFFFSSLVKSLYLLPILSWFLLDQIVILLQVNPDNEDIQLESEENRLSHQGDYKKLIAVYDNLFGGQALISYYINEDPPERSVFSGPTEEQMKRADNPELLEAICRGVNNLLKPLPTGYIDALVDLINGKSVAVFDSISGEFLLFYLSYLQKELFLRRTALVVCDTEPQVTGIILQLREIFLRLNKSHEIWKISDINTMLLTNGEDLDILVCTEEQLIQQQIEKKIPRFYHCLHHVLVIHAYDIMCRYNAIPFRFFELLKKQQIQYAFFVPENNRDMDSALELRLNNAEIQLYNSFDEGAGACILCWRGESYYKTQQAISMELYHDFGLAYTIAVIAVKHGVSKISMYAPSDVPLLSYASTLKHYLSSLTKHYFLIDSVSMESVVVHNPIVAFQHRDLMFDIFFDEYNNLLNVAMQALSGGGELTSMFHIISRPYMLRDYFACHVNSLVHNDKGMQMIVPVFYHDRKAPSATLLIRLYEKGMMMEDIISYMKPFGVMGDNVEEVLRTVVITVLGADPHVHIYSYFSFGAKEVSEFRDDNYHYSRFIRLTSEFVYQKACALSEQNIVITGAHHEVLPFPRTSAYNRFLPGQLHCFGGERFKIISMHHGDITVRDEETVEREKEYTTIFDLPLVMIEMDSSKTGKHNTYYSLEIFKAKVTRSIKGYFSHTNGLDFYDDNTMRYQLDQSIEETKDVSCLRIKLLFPFKKNYDTAAALFVVLMRGILETALPKNYQDILVVSLLEDQAFDKELFDDTPLFAVRKDPVPSDWMEAEDNELPLSQQLKELFPTIGETNLEPNGEEEVNLYLIDFSENDSHVLAGIQEEVPRLFNVMYGYLDWVIKNPQLSHCYLRFGYHQVPGIFHLPVVYDCLQRIAQYSPEVSAQLRGKLTSFDLSEKIHCSFCGSSVIVSSWVFDDERIMCENCYSHRTTERKEIQVLLKRAIQTMESQYHIKLPVGIKIKFKSAASIKKQIPSISNGRVLGFYSFGRRELWVERGGPEPCVLATLMHELTHAWQHENIQKDLDLMYIEGHSTFVEIECTRLLGQRAYANYLEKSILSRNDEYAQGLRYWKERMKIESDKNIFHHILLM